MSTVRDIATVPRRAIEEAKPHHASIPALIPPADPVRLNPIQPNPWAETLGVFFIAAVIALVSLIDSFGEQLSQVFMLRVFDVDTNC
jgi:hypothetical protein